MSAGKLLVTLSVFSLLVGGAHGESSETLKDVPYADDPHPEQRLDFSWPERRPADTVLFIHGGSLKESAERRASRIYRDVCRPFLAAGVACATMDYRLFPSFQWPTMAQDVVAAIRKVRQLIAERDGDPRRLFLFGHSSGCHLAAVVGTNPTYLAAADLAPSDLAGVIAMGCTLDRHDLALRGVSVEDLRERFARSSYVKLYRTADNFIAANPAHHLGPHVPPTLVVVAHEERFFPSILEQGARFVRLLLKEDVAADLVIVPGSHNSSIEDLAKPGDPGFEKILAFIRDPKSAGADSR